MSELILGIILGGGATGLCLITYHLRVMADEYNDNAARLSEAKRVAYAAGYHDRAMLDAKAISA